MIDSDYIYSYMLDYPKELLPSMELILKKLNYNYDNHVMTNSAVIAFYYNTTMEPYMTDIIKLVESYNAIHGRTTHFRIHKRGEPVKFFWK